MSQAGWAMILFYGAAQGLFLAGALVSRQRGRQLSNMFLSGLVLINAMVVVYWLFVALGLTEFVAPIVYVTSIFLLGTGPLFYFYARTLLYPEYTPRIRTVVLLVPVAGAIRLGLEGIGRLTTGAIVEQADQWHETAVASVTLMEKVGLLLQTAYLFVFLFLAWRCIRGIEVKLQDERTAGSGPHITWLKILNGSLFLFALLSGLTFVSWFGAQVPSLANNYLLAAIRCLIIQGIAIAAFFVPEAFTTAMTDLAVKYRRAPIEGDTAQRYVERIQQLMETEKPHRRIDLRLADMAEQLSMPSHVLSRVINEHLGMSFADYVNEYRVREAKALLKSAETEHYTLGAIAEEAGFNSRASFNRVFKKHTGVPPSEYRRSLHDDENHWENHA